MEASPIHERCDGPSVHAIDTSTEQRETVRRQIRHGWRKIELALEPRIAASCTTSSASASFLVSQRA